MSRGRAYPKTAIHKAIANEIIRLGYTVSAIPTTDAVVSIEQLTLSSDNGSDSIKESDNYECTWLLSVVCREDVPTKTDKATEKIRANMQISIDGYSLQNGGLQFDSCVDFEELDSQGTIRRTEQRCRILITKTI